MDDLRSLLAQAGVAIRDSGQNNVGVNFIGICCVYCGESGYHLGINTSEWYWKCWKCGEHGQWFQLAKKLAELYPRVDWKVRPGDAPLFLDTYTKYIKLRSDLKELTRPFHSYDFNEIADEDAYYIWYLVGEFDIEDNEQFYDSFRPRSLDSSLVKQIRPGIGLGKLSGYITFIEGGQLIARNTFDNGNPKWWKSTNDTSFLYGLDAVRGLQPEWVCVTEGVLDVLSLPYGHAVGILGSTASDTWVGPLVEALETTRVIILALDRDVHECTITKLRLEFSQFDYEVYVFDWEDSELVGLKDLDEVRLHHGSTWLMDRFFQVMAMDGEEVEEGLLL